MKIATTTQAWITESNDVTPQQLRTPEGIATLFYSPNDMSSIGWTRVGMAAITVDLVDERQLVDNKIASLREQAATLRADATAKVTRIEGQIQQLLAIENSPAVAS